MVIKMKEYLSEQERAERKQKRAQKLNDAARWAERNRETLSIAIPAGIVVLSGLGKVSKQVSKHVSLKKQLKLKESFIYDRSLGAYLELKRPLKGSQLTTVLRRKENGERLSKILDEMNLLK